MKKYKIKEHKISYLTEPRELGGTYCTSPS